MRAKPIVLVVLLVTALVGSSCSVGAAVDNEQVLTTASDPQPTATPAPAAPETTSVDPTAAPDVQPTALPESVQPEPTVAGEGDAIAEAWALDWGLRGGGETCWTTSGGQVLTNVSTDEFRPGDVLTVVTFCGIEEEVIDAALVTSLGLSAEDARCVTQSLTATDLSAAATAAIAVQANQNLDPAALQAAVESSGCLGDSPAITVTEPDRSQPPVPPPPASDRLGDLVGPTIAAQVSTLYRLSGDGLACWNANASIGFSNVSGDWITNGGTDDRLEQFLAEVLVFCEIADDAIGAVLNFEFGVAQAQASCIADSLSPSELIIAAAVAGGDQGNPEQRETTVQLLIDSYPECATG